MDRNESEQWMSEHAADTERAANGLLPRHYKDYRIEPSAAEKRNGVYEEIGQLKLEVERLRDQQQALQRTPPSNDTRVDDDVEHAESDDSNTKDPADRRPVLHRRAVRLFL